MNITKDTLVIGAGCGDAIASAWLAPMMAAMEKFEINTPLRIAAFLANVGVESNGLSALSENLKYSANRLANTWPNRYAVDASAMVKQPNGLAIKLANNPEAIANNVYANRMGNGDEASGDGWHNRGQGPIQITGNANLTRCAAAIGINVVSNPAALQEPVAGSLSAAWFFSSTGCNELADASNIAGVIKKINGTSPCVANNGAKRIKLFEQAFESLSA